MISHDQNQTSIQNQPPILRTRPSCRLTTTPQHATMGIKNMFKRKEPTEEELREDLNNLGITTRSHVGGREEKFGAFREYAQQKSQQKQGFAPKNPYANVQNGAPGTNPYAQNAAEQQDHADLNANPDPYGQRQGSPYGSLAGNQAGNTGTNAANPYEKQNQTNAYGQGQKAANSYGQNASSNNAYGQRPGSAGSRPGFNSNPYGAGEAGIRAAGAAGAASGAVSASNGGTASNPYASRTNVPYDRGLSRRDADEESLDLNAISSNFPAAAKPFKRPQQQYGASGEEVELDLNALPEDDDLNLQMLPEQQEVNSEDEEIEAIRQDIRFIKQESVALTRNTLRMAQEADALASNTLGMLGSQSERLYNAELNLLLAETQTKIAEDKVEQLRRLNRSIFIPATSVNPFNKKSKLRQQELKLKTEKAQEKYLRETNRQGVYESEQRIKEGLVSNSFNSTTHQKYKGEQSLEAAKRYQFENDSEDDEMEKEMASNLDQIGVFAKKLKQSAATMGKEVDSQNQRLRKIEDDADRLDINVHLNNTRLSNIR